jgi:flagellar basal body P-ring protein FlgI
MRAKVGSSWLSITVNNTGTADAKLEYIVVNGTAMNRNVIIPYNSKAEIELPLKNPPFKPGSKVELRLHTVTGKDLRASELLRPVGT